MSSVPAFPSPPSPSSPQASPPAPADQQAKLGFLRVAKVVVVFVYIVVAVNLVLLTTGFILRLFGASTEAAFTRWIYRNVDRIMEPFRGIFPTHAVSDTSVIDSSLLFAMIVYALLALALHALVTWLTQKIVRLRRLDQPPPPTTWSEPAPG
ncbi:MAG TPA: hypothetical protein VGJ86_17490 [Acidimicrobiales bacterium]|jgi:uncharacterized protein YggT (Ycf19 family)